MSHLVYSGEGTYDPDTLIATYNVYLPALTQGTYKFFTKKIYNFSCNDYPNTIMLFMAVLNGSNEGYKGSTNQAGTPVSFSLAATFLENIDSSCTPLSFSQDINVILMHDDDKDLVFAGLNYYNTTPPPPEEDVVNGGLENAGFKPKKAGFGTLVIKKK